MKMVMLVAPSVMLLGAFVAANAKKAGDQQRRVKLLAAAQGLWVIAGVLAMVVVAGGVVALTGADQERPDIGDGVATIVCAGLFAAACVSLLGHFGFWRAVGRRLRAASSSGRERVVR